MSMKKTIRELLSTEDLIVAPEIHDALSARTVEACGFKATILSSGAFTSSICGIPDLATMTLDEAAWYTQRICSASNIPMIIDCIEGFGQPLNTYHAVKRLAAAGAGGILLTEQYDCHTNRLGLEGILPAKQAAERMKAGIEAVKGTDCVLVARVDPDPVQHFDEVVERMCRYQELGADMVLPVKLNSFNGTPEEREAFVNKLGRQVPGIKWYPDLSFHDGIPELNLANIVDSGFKFIGVHYPITMALLGMVEAGLGLLETHDVKSLKKLEDMFPDERVQLEQVCSCLDYGESDWREVECRIFNR